MACMSSENTCWVINAELGLSALPPLFTHCAIPCNSLGQKSSTEPCQPVKDPFPYSSTSTPVLWLPEIWEIVKYQNRPLCPTCSHRICFSAPNPVATGKEKSLVEPTSCSGWTWKFGCKCRFVVAVYFGGLSHQGILVEQFCQLDLELMQKCHISKLMTQQWCF